MLHQSRRKLVEVLDFLGGYGVQPVPKPRSQAHIWHLNIYLREPGDTVSKPKAYAVVVNCQTATGALYAAQGGATVMDPSGHAVLLCEWVEFEGAWTRIKRLKTAETVEHIAWLPTHSIVVVNELGEADANPFGFSAPRRT